MADLKNLEKRAFETLLGMGGGYVLDFSNRTFGEFVLDCTGMSIYEPRYGTSGGSKANLLRAFWKHEPNQTVGKLLAELIAYAQESNATLPEPLLLEACRRTAERLQADGLVVGCEAFV